MSIAGVGGADNGGARRMNILWSNVQVLKPSIYGRQPTPIAERRFLDKDPTGRVASQILERALRGEMGESGFHDAIEQVVQDYLLVGRGTAWLRYKPLFGPASSFTDRGDDDIDPSGDDYDPPESAKPTYDPEVHDEDLSNASKQEIEEKLLGATMEVDYVHWKDFLTGKARFWKENEWVARRIYMSRQDCIDAFGKVVGKEIPLEMTPEVEPGSIGNRFSRNVPEDAKKAIVYEIWFKPKREVYFIAKGYEFLLEAPREDPLGLEGFWPCPKPLYATMTNDTLEPVPDYVEYQDQALEIDSLTNRIDNLIKALKVAGVYNASEKQLARLLDEGYENQLIPVQNWAAFAEKGGIANAISFLPIKEVADVLGKLFEARDKIKNDLYEITGIADIMRGQADPRETASAITSKGRWGSLRLQQRQAEVARFCRDTIKMMGEIIAIHYPDSSLIEVSGIMYDEGIGPEPPPKPPLQSPAAPPPSPSLPGAVGQAGPPVPQLGGPAPPPGMGPGVPPAPGPPAPMGAPISPPAPMAGGPGPNMSPLAPQGAGGIPPQIAQMLAQQQYQQLLILAEKAKMEIINKAIALLRNDKLRGFRIDIETDSTINDSAREEKTERIEFMTALSGFVEKAMMAAQQYPDMIPLLGKSLLFTVRGFRVGRDLESSIEEFVDKAEQDAKKAQGQPKPPSPEQIKANADIQMAQAGLQEAQMKLQADQARSQAEIQAQQIEAASEQKNLELKQQMQQVELKIKMMEAQNRQREMENKAAYEQAQHQSKMEALAMDVRAKHADNQLMATSRNLDIKQKLTEAELAAQAREHEAKVKAQAHEHAVRVKAAADAHQAQLKAHDAKLKMRDKYPNKKMPGTPDVPELGSLPNSPLTEEQPDPAAPIPGARKAPDGNYYLKHPSGQYYRVDKKSPQPPKVKEPSELEKLQIEETKQRIRHAEEQHQAQLEKAKKPRKVVRDKDGKIAGIE